MPCHEKRVISGKKAEKKTREKREEMRQRTYCAGVAVRNPFAEFSSEKALLVAHVQHALVERAITELLGFIARPVAYIVLVAARVEVEFRHEVSCSGSTTSVADRVKVAKKNVQ